MRRIGLLVLFAAAIAGTACELAGFQRACFEGRDCERHPVNAGSGIGLPGASGGAPDFHAPQGR